MDDIIVEKLKLDVPEADLTSWENVFKASKNSDSKVKIAMVGKYVDFKDSYISLSEASLNEIYESLKSTYFPTIAIFTFESLFFDALNTFSHDVKSASGTSSFNFSTMMSSKP